MRIFVFIERYPNPYKPYIDTQLVEFLRRGHEVRVFAGGAFRDTVHEEVLRYRLAEKTRYYPETLKDLPRYLLPALLRLLRAPVTMWTRLRRGVEAGDSFKSRLMTTARMLVLPLEEPDLCLIHNLSTVSRLAFLPACYPASRVVMYFHGGEVGGVPRVTGEHTLFNRMHAVFTNTQYSKNLAVARGCDPARVTILPVGFALTDYVPPPDRRYRPAGTLRLVSVGRLGEEKGFHVALDAIRQLVAKGHANIHYSVVGSGQRRQTLQQYVEDHRLGDYVSFLGEKEKREIVSLLSVSDVLVLPSLETATWAETQACVVQEAMLMGLPVITTTAGGVPESIPAAMKEFSVPPGDAPAICEQVVKLLAKDEAALHTLGEMGRAFVVQHYDIVSITQTFLARALAAS